MGKVAFLTSFFLGKYATVRSGCFIKDEERRLLIKQGTRIEREPERRGKFALDKK